MPKPRNAENESLPTAWRYKHGWYFYRVPSHERRFWHGKSEVALGKTLEESREKLRIRAFGYEIPERDKSRLDFAANGEIDRNDIPANLSGVYFLFQRKKLVYIGQSENVLVRVTSHDRNGHFDTWTFVEEQDPEKRYEMEQWAIFKWEPPLNWSPIDRSPE